MAQQQRSRSRGRRQRSASPRRRSPARRRERRNPYSRAQPWDFSDWKATMTKPKMQSTIRKPKIN